MSTSRIWVVGQRGLHNSVARTISIEFEDVVVDTSAARFLSPTPGRWSGPLQRVQRAASRRVARASSMPNGNVIADPGGECDLLLVVCAFQRDLPAITALSDWDRRAGKKVLWLEDLWLDDVGRWPGYLELMTRFDHIFLNFENAADRLAQVTGVPTDYSPFGVDALRFCPWPDPPDRVIDVVNVGRRSEVTHEAVRARRDLYYRYDTTLATGVDDPQQHREQYAATAQRARYFIANRAKFQHANVTDVPPELGARFFEGAAAGAVLIGDHPGGPVFDEFFGWEDSLIVQPADAPDILDVIAELDADPGRRDAISRRNAANCLRRHDWGHRFAQVLDVAELPHPDRLTERLARMDALARDIDG